MKCYWSVTVKDRFTYKTLNRTYNWSLLVHVVALLQFLCCLTVISLFELQLSKFLVLLFQFKFRFNILLFLSCPLLEWMCGSVQYIGVFVCLCFTDAWCCCRNNSFPQLGFCCLDAIWFPSMQCRVDKLHFSSMCCNVQSLFISNWVCLSQIMSMDMDLLFWMFWMGWFFCFWCESSVLPDVVVTLRFCRMCETNFAHTWCFAASYTIVGWHLKLRMSWKVTPLFSPVFTALSYTCAPPAPAAEGKTAKPFETSQLLMGHVYCVCYCTLKTMALTIPLL